MEPRVLLLSSNPPYGESFGAAFRARLVAEGLRLAGRVSVIPVPWGPWSREAYAATAERLDAFPQVLQSEQPKRASTTIWRNVSASCMNTDDRAVSPADRSMVMKAIAGADAIWVEEIGIANALRIWRWDRSILDADDLASRYQRSRRVSVRGRERIRSMWQSSLWRRREATYLERFSRVVVTSEDDRNYLGSGRRVSVIPNAFDDSGIRICRTAAGVPRFGFVGIMDYEPNQDAVRWFAREVMPQIVRESGCAEFRIVGKAGAEWLKAEGLSGTALGYLEDPTDEMATWTAMVVPIRFGAGTRIKIAEAFARRIPVVSTTTGAFGYEVAHGRELLLADSPAEFARACLMVAQNTSMAKSLADAGAHCFHRRYSAESVRQRVRSVVHEVLEASARESRASRSASTPVAHGAGLSGMS